MRINLKRFTIGAMLLVTLSLLLQGCGSNSETPIQFADQKQISGIVSDITTNLPLARASVVAYPIVGGVANLSAPLSVPVRSDASGYYMLQIPASYTGSVMIKATVPVVAKLVGLPYTTTVIRVILPDTTVQLAKIPATMINFASETASVFVEQNFGATGFTSHNIKTALISLESLFGVNFSQTVLPKKANDVSTTKAQQDLQVSIKAVQAVNATIALEALVIKMAATGGLGTTSDQLISNIGSISTQLILTGSLPATYSPSTAIVSSITTLKTTPVSLDPVGVNDTTAPTAPTSLAATVGSTYSPVSLTWRASTISSGTVTGYLVYRAFSSGEYSLLDTVTTGVTYSDVTTSPATAYKYKVVAYSAGRMNSGDSNVATVTTPSNVPPVVYHTLTGKVTYNGAGVPGVVITIIGTGYGSALTDLNGNYSFSNIVNGSYNLSAALDGYIFNPSSLSVVVNGADISGLDFISNRPGTINGNVTYPSGTIIGGISYPPGTIIGGITYPSGVVIGGITYPTATVIGGVIYPTGTVVGGITYPDGIIIAGVNYPSGTVVGGVAYPPSTVTGTVVYPTGAVSGVVTYPGGAVSVDFVLDSSIVP